jgi:hypothetical protein
MAALIEGDLVADSRWGIALRDSTGTFREVIWPFGYTARPGDPPELLDERGQTVARVGDRVGIGGGEDASNTWIACPGEVHRLGTDALTDAWGRLSVVRPSNAVMEALATGTLLITDECVILRGTDGGKEWLAWPADRTTWDAVTRTITLRNVDGRPATFRDGDRIQLGGGEGIVRPMDWIAPPGPSCWNDAYWIVGETPRGD